MNKDNVKKLISKIEKAPPEQMIMSAFYRLIDNTREPKPCNTAYCVAGWCAVLAGKDVTIEGMSIGPIARDFLDIDLDESSQLFHMENQMPASIVLFDYLDPTRRKFITLSVLRKFLKTGEITWSDYGQEMREAHAAAIRDDVISAMS